MEQCIRCKRNEGEAELFEGIYINEPVKICERCSLMSNIPIIKTPSLEQLKNSEKTESVRKRMARLAGIKNDVKKTENVYEELKKLDQSSVLERISPAKLVDNYHWIVQYMRRRKKLSVKQLAEQVGESEIAIGLVERGHLPTNYMALIKKLEQFFGVRLIKPDPRDIMLKENEAERLKKEKIKEEVVLKTQKDGIDASWKGNTKLAELMQKNKIVERDFPKKSKEEVGHEQVDGFGSEPKTRLDELRAVRTKDADIKKASKKTPTIYDLVKQKEEREKALTGHEIDVVEDAADSEDDIKEQD